MNSQYILSKAGYRLKQPILVIMSYGIRSLIHWILVNLQTTRFNLLYRQQVESDVALTVGP
jgi:hypothetical protein